MHLLVVDDDLLIVEVVSGILRSAGYEVESALSAEAALRAMGHARPRLVVLDARMPGMDGFAMLTALKADPAWAVIPVIMLTSLHTRADVLRAHQLGAAGFVAKPLDAPRLLHQVKVCLARTTQFMGQEKWEPAARGLAYAECADTWLL
jgi:DNA-binding response OmpR family regulator